MNKEIRRFRKYLKKADGLEIYIRITPYNPIIVAPPVLSSLGRITNLMIRDIKPKNRVKIVMDNLKLQIRDFEKYLIEILK